jgi:endonuclease YncB( thermonuclease family)
MGFRFRKSFRILPGIRLNLNAKSKSVRFGPRGLGYTVSTTGKRRITASIPGTGLSYSEVTNPKRKSAGSTVPTPSSKSRAKNNRIWIVALGIVAVLVGAGVASNGRSSPDSQIPATPQTALTTPSSVMSAVEVRFVTASSLNIRAEPSTTSDVVGRVKSRDELTVLESKGGWLKIHSAGGQGWVSEQFTSPSRPAPPEVLAPASPATAVGQRVQFSMCGRNRHTCVVDGDTIWLNGQNLRLQSFDTPEPYNDICGGPAEVELAGRASARLLQLLNSSAFTVETGGEDRYRRTLATVRINGVDVGDILIAERLARRWPDGDEWWCPL